MITARTTPQSNAPRRPGPVRGSVLVIVLWITFGLVAMTLYFAQAMNMELRASDNQVSSVMADQALEGAVRYVSFVLTNQATNGWFPEPTSYLNEAVPVGESRFWIIGRPDPFQVQQGTPNRIAFGLVDEASKLNLNTTPLTNLQYLPRMTPEVAAAIVDWRDADENPGSGGVSGAENTVYSMLHPAYLCKNTNYETIDELRWVAGTSMELLAGEDLNRNGVLDPGETDDNRNSLADPGLLEYVTVWSREPNTYSNGLARVNIQVVSLAGTLPTLLGVTINPGRVPQIMNNLGVRAASPGGGGGGGGGGGASAQTAQDANFTSPLHFYRQSRMTPEEFAAIANFITMTNGSNIIGRVNVNTASAAVLSSLPGMTADLAQQMVTYRQSNPDKTTSVAWVVEALGANNDNALRALQGGDYLTTQSYQFSADIAAVGPFGRGYRRVRYVFDTCDGTARIVYRQDLTHLGWALGKEARDTWVAAKKTR